MDLAWLDKLNDRQRQAVEFGVGSEPAPPLLVIAGAGSGKTSTLAHRVAHLLVKGADPRRILLRGAGRLALAAPQRRGVDRPRRGAAPSGPRLARRDRHTGSGSGSVS
ncbi:UvrD-helicase domain-containing protein [Cereibacter sphaeroides]|uniref:UvrD-helicase domain-containing protein n=1 Tax=Cereibacter sphaeroides TaxID=1063 RepID=UPI001F1F40FC|nr:UvrD-helicase domain-containing protein [Cereibacter sphaeroides]MCE6961733.1 UvrD-helicase domain-containing protein [Cereibacter sphaeroides]MCE6970509.1 UvrD-helicase domain-containing protein [Cereibacter sphaeroides]MCE6975083.1 UvrD-helicase domain-containing protein [Cereibacter sphaeroides]